MSSKKGTGNERRATPNNERRAGARARPSRGANQNMSDAKTPVDEKKPVMDIIAIQKLLPHRFPFLLVDRVIECEPEKRLVAYKNVSINEPFFAGHFPGH